MMRRQSDKGGRGSRLARLFRSITVSVYQFLGGHEVGASGSFLGRATDGPRCPRDGTAAVGRLGSRLAVRGAPSDAPAGSVAQRSKPLRPKRLQIGRIFITRRRRRTSPDCAVHPGPAGVTSPPATPEIARGGEVEGRGRNLGGRAPAVITGPGGDFVQVWGT